ncbi:RHS repeat-associated core domain-containing protein [Pseudomonas sp. IT-196MI5]|uniref:RHS repeat-associated core domain-containing protein n=1 Tax=Pseudomonas sp. IT-196MI5 TaxID=3026440 RepID=UPI0039E10E30
MDHAHHGTPVLAVSDPRGLGIRAIQYHRRLAGDPLEARVTHQRFNAAGRPVASRDPYLFALAQNDASVPANLSQVFSLSGAPLSSDSVDAGWRVALHGAARQRVAAWDGRGSHSLTEFDVLLRPVAVRERGEDVAEHVLERFTYAGVEAGAALHNLCGQLIRHDDPAGTLHLNDLGIAGALLQQTRHFLLETNPVNWPDSVPARDALLEPAEGATTARHHAASGELLQQIDALGNQQRFAYSVAGELNDTRLTLAGPDGKEHTLVSHLRYNASGQIEAETAGNGVVTRHHYDPADGRLIGLSAHKANGTPLQDLKYSYDAAGNVLSLEDAAQPIRYFNNQRIEPIKTYRYDTLDQLIEATGWEAKTGHGGPALPDLQPLPLDPNQVANYSQTYHYDAGGNLLDLTHVGAQSHSRTLTRAQYSNRCLSERNGRPPTEDELAAGFDANGNLRELQAGQSLAWDLRNQLSTVRPVVREDGNDDYERYIYDGGGQRGRKLRSNQTNARTLISEVRYLPGVEIRSHSGTGEILHVINASAGSNSVQVLHWVAKPPENITNDQVRYSLNDHLQSSTLELDQNADLISQEWYYPYGGTACFAARSATEAKYKTVRYSGKERDATGLYYYGFRYYAPWLQRWINPDPAGYVDGMNLFAMVRNMPINYGDLAGHAGKDLTQKDLDKIASSIKKNMADLPEEAVIDVINQYLTNKGADPQQYLDTIKSLLGFATTKAVAGTSMQPPATKYDRDLKENEKKGLHLFWSTNAGAQYINAITRNFYTGDTIQEPTSLQSARDAAFKELKSNLGSTTIKMSSATQKDSYSPAMELLVKHENNSRQTILLMKASLGAQLKSAVFRGARLPDSNIKEGDILQTSGFTSFSPNERTARAFTDRPYDLAFNSKTTPVMFITDGGYRIEHGTEEESAFPPMTQFKVTGVYSGKKNTPNIYLEKIKFKSTPSARWI